MSANDDNQGPTPDEEGGLIVRPQPLFVLKTRDLKSGWKLFVNLCTSEYVRPSSFEQ